MPRCPKFLILFSLLSAKTFAADMPCEKYLSRQQIGINFPNVVASPFVQAFRLPAEHEPVYSYTKGEYYVSETFVGFSHVPYVSFVSRGAVDHEIESDLSSYFKIRAERGSLDSDRALQFQHKEANLSRSEALFVRASTRQGETSEFFRLSKASPTNFLPFEDYVEMPERKDPRFREGKLIIFEIGRIFTRGALVEFQNSFSPLFLVAGTTLDKYYLSQGIDVVVYAHTTDIGARRFSSAYKIPVFRSSQDLQMPDENLLRVEGQHIPEIYGSRRQIYEQALDNLPSFALLPRLNAQGWMPEDMYQNSADFIFGAHRGFQSADLGF